MNRLIERVCVAACVVCLACNSDSDEPQRADAGSDEQPAPAGRDAGVEERPEGWDAASHGNDAEPDYERVFSTVEVHRLDIVMSSESRQAMLDDMKMLLGEPGNGEMSGFRLPPELTEACEGKKASDRCEARAAAGSCTEIPGGVLLCLTEGGGIGGPPGGGRPGGGGPIDLVPSDPIYVPVTIKYDGRAWTQVGMRYKGNSSLASAWRQGRLKLGFRLHFDRYEDERPEIADQRFFGFRELTFSSGWNDSSLIRDALASELLRSLGLPAARAAFYTVYVDAGAGPEYWGLYTMLEDPSDVLAKVQFEDGGGNMYKPDGVGADFSMFSEEGFVKKSNEGAADWSDVQRAIDALHASREDAAAWRSGLEAVFDVGVFLRTLALSRAIGHWDSYGRMAHNYYLYGDPSNGGRLTWISWDHNLAWQGGGAMPRMPQMPAPQGEAPPRPAGFGGFGDLSVMMDEVPEGWPLIRFLMDDPIYREQYREALEETLAGDLQKATFDARATELHALIAPYVLGDDSGALEASPYTHLSNPDAFRNALVAPTSGLLDIAEQRRAAVRAALE